MDNSVDNFVDKLWLWITHELSTIYPQDIASYPQFCPQVGEDVFGLGKGNFGVIHTIHSPYYYYYSNR